MKKIIALFLTLLIIVCFSACSKSENDTSSTDTVIDSGTVSADNKYNVSKYASISSKELIEILGQPSSVDNGYGKGFCDIPCVYYNYDNHETFGSLSFAIINDSVVRLSSYKTYDYKESDLTDTDGLLKYFGIEKQENCETIVQNELAHRYRCPSQNVDDFYIGLIGQAKDDCFGILEVTYDMSYYEEWYLPYEYDEWTGYKAQTETTIKSMLHSPNSAKFPYDSWDFAKNDYYFKVVGKVNADNLFGATLTYDFTFIYDNTGKCVYALFGDEEVNDGYKATKDILKATFDQTKHNQSLNATDTKANNVDNPTSDNNQSANKPNKNQNSNNNSSNKNNEDKVWDAVAEYCNTYNENYRTYDESIGFVVNSRTKVTITHSAYEIPESDSNYIYSARDSMLDSLISHLETYNFPEAITVNVNEDYHFTSNDYEEDSYEDDTYEEETTDYDDTQLEPEENDYDTLVAAANQFCNSYSCEYGTLTAKVWSNKVGVDITVTSDSGTPVNDDSYAIRQKISDDARAYFNNYADFPEFITVVVWLE